jgi:hypothetical protein
MSPDPYSDSSSDDDEYSPYLSPSRSYRGHQARQANFRTGYGPSHTPLLVTLPQWPSPPHAIRVPARPPIVSPYFPPAYQTTSRSAEATTTRDPGFPDTAPTRLDASSSEDVTVA